MHVEYHIDRLEESADKSYLVRCQFRTDQTKSIIDQGAKKNMSNQDAVQLLIPDTMPKSVGYSQLAIVSKGKVIFIAGQVALDKSGNVVGKDDFRAQVQQVFENLKAAVEAAGGHFRDIIKLNSYFLDLSHLPVFREVRDRYIDLAKPPASTAIQVPKLFRPEFLMEIEAVAVVQDI
jgi:enamine deaminase RidA (YjgF/YER057c/UK114 family)